MLAFCNSYTERLWVAYMFWSPEDCGGEGGNWQTIGWFAMEPGSCVTVYANDLDDVNNRYWYYHAENASGSVVWGGPVRAYITDAAFNRCLTFATSESRIVGFRRIDVGDNDDFTVTLIP